MLWGGSSARKYSSIPSVEGDLPAEIVILRSSTKDVSDIELLGKRCDSPRNKETFRSIKDQGFGVILVTILRMAK